MKLQPSNSNPELTRVILVRHGRSTYNDQGRYQGSSDEALLTEKGRQDAFHTGLALQDIAFSALYTSPLIRTQQTAQEILAALKFSRCLPLPIHTHPDLKEIDLPRWAGLSYQRVRETLKADYRCWIERPHQFEMWPLEKSERPRPRRPVQELYAQARRFWQAVLPRHAGKTILVVSHGGTIKALLSTALGISCDRFHSLQQSNCGISVLSFERRQSACLEVMNDTHHLGECLPKLKAGRQGLRLLLVPDNSVPAFLSVKDVLAPIDIDFSLSNGKAAQSLSQQLLQHHPQTIQLQTNRGDVSRCWLRELKTNQFTHSVADRIMTGLVVAKPTILQEMLSHTIGAGTSNLPLPMGPVSVMHFARSQPLPILQALNFSASALSMGGLTVCAS